MKHPNDQPYALSLTPLPCVRSRVTLQRNPSVCGFFLAEEKNKTCHFAPFRDWTFFHALVIFGYFFIEKTRVQSRNPKKKHSFFLQSMIALENRQISHKPSILPRMENFNPDYGTSFCNINWCHCDVPPKK